MAPIAANGIEKKIIPTSAVSPLSSFLRDTASISSPKRIHGRDAENAFLKMRNCGVDCESRSVYGCCEDSLLRDISNESRTAASVVDWSIAVSDESCDSFCKSDVSRSSFVIAKYEVYDSKINKQAIMIASRVSKKAMRFQEKS